MRYQRFVSICVLASIASIASAQPNVTFPTRTTTSARVSIDDSLRVADVIDIRRCADSGNAKYLTPKKTANVSDGGSR